MIYSFTTLGLCSGPYRSLNSVLISKMKNCDLACYLCAVIHDNAVVQLNHTRSTLLGGQSIINGDMHFGHECLLLTVVICYSVYIEHIISAQQLISFLVPFSSMHDGVQRVIGDHCRTLLFSMPCGILCPLYGMFGSLFRQNNKMVNSPYSPLCSDE